MNNLLFSLVEISNKLVILLNNSLGIWYLIILNAFGVLAICCKVCEYQIRQRKVIFLVGMTAQILWMLYFILQGDFVSGIVSVVSFFSVLLFSKKEKYKWARNPLWLVFFFALQITISFFSFKTWMDIFPLLAGLSATSAYYCVDLKKFRAISLVCSILWLVNSILKVYIVALLSDVFSTISVSVGIVRYDVLNKIKKNKELE